MKYAGSDNMGHANANFNPVRDSGTMPKADYKKCLKCGRVLPITPQNLRRKYCVGRCIPKDKLTTDLTRDLNIKISVDLLEKVQFKANSKGISTGAYIRQLIQNAN